MADWTGTCSERVALTDRILRYGVFYSQIDCLDGRRMVLIAILPPRYRGSDIALALFAGLDAILSSLKGGTRAALTWNRQI